jgi:hypothetical protein
VSAPASQTPAADTASPRKTRGGVASPRKTKGESK